MGMNRAQEGEMAIIGGTGEFAMARGIIKYNALANPPTFQTIKELNIHAFYVKPAVSTYIQLLKLYIFFFVFLACISCPAERNLNVMVLTIGRS